MKSPESLFASWLSGRESAEPIDLEELVRAHPELEEGLRELHAQWRRLEDLRQRFGLSGSLAERLRTVHGSEVDPKVELPDEGSGDFTKELVGRLSDRTQASTRYLREGELARGGMGAVLQVWDADLRRRLAMKVLLDGSAGGGELPSQGRRLLARLLEEAQVTAQLDHPGIVPVHELGLAADGEVYFTMKLVKGKTLALVFEELAAGKGGWTQTRVLGLLVKVCEAMSYAHAKGVIHRDLKPANVMVGKFGEVYVMDWGLAKVLGRADDKDVRVQGDPEATLSQVRSDRRDHADELPDSPLYTMDGDVVGTPAYMSPEQANGRVSEMGPPSDVYALGAMLYHLLSGHVPYVPPGAHLNNLAVWSQVQSGPPTALHEAAPDAPAELTAICERAMERDAGARYADMSALAQDLSAYVEDRVVSAYETGAWAEARKWFRRNKSLAAALGAAVLLLVGGLATTLYLRQQSQANFVLAEKRRGEAEENFLLAEQRREAAEASETEATKRTEEVLRLSALQDYDQLLARADGLWPAHPENIPSLEAWLGEARTLVADLPLHREKLAELRASASSQTDEERDRERRAHPDFERLETLQGLIHSRRAALRQRRDGLATATFEPDWSALPTEWSALNDLAWTLISPDRKVFGREAEGLALMQRASELLEGLIEADPTLLPTNPSLLASVRDNLSLALFALGRDAEALAASRSALEAATEERREEYAEYVANMEGWTEEASSQAGLESAAAELAALEADREVLEARVSERRTWLFPETEAGRQARWWHANLTKLIAALEDLQDERAGLLSESKDAASAENGWSLPRRLAFAELLQAADAPGGEWRNRWTAANAAIQQNPRYAGLELVPQTGLVPIGPDPDSDLWEFVHLATGAEPERGEDGRLVLTEDMGLVLVLVPGGSFWMGASADPEAEHNFDPYASEDEGPVHQVTLSPYFLSKYEMTQGQWLRFTGANPSLYEPKRSEMVSSLMNPVEQVTWTDAKRELQRMGLQLPTEAQWENGCRAGSETPWWPGSEREALMELHAANLADQTAARAGAPWQEIQDWPELDDGFAIHAKVGTFAANALGLSEVHGNIWEWCLDGRDPEFIGYEPGPKTDPATPWEGAPARATRGGGYSSSATNARSAYRSGGTPSTVDFVQGVRPARAVSK